MENKLRKFIQLHEKKVIPLSKQAAEAYFNASISGKPEDYQKAADLELKLNKIYANKKEFAELKQIKESNSVKNTLLKRQLDILYNDYLSKQIDEKLLEEIIQIQTKNENIYATHRVNVNGKTYTDNEVDEVLKTSKDNNELKNIWIASKKIGQIVETDVLKLLKLRNQSAQQLGFDNYHSMSLILSEQDPRQINELFDELDKLTRIPFKKAKKEIDEYLARRFEIQESELMPWHYQDRFFQEAPEIYDTNLDKYFENEDIKSKIQNYFSAISLPIDDLLQNSDLYEKEGKYQHAYCMDVDRQGDIRVVCNIKPNSNWMGTMLHEFGHAVYDKYIDQKLPWILRTHAHVFTTEAIAMFFGRLVSNPLWLNSHVRFTDDSLKNISDNVQKNMRINLLVFSRWAQVMYRFEKQLYKNPDQDLNSLWWQLVENYQLLKQPENRHAPDWAAKIHLAIYPAYYHNYLLGELLASQIAEAMHRSVLDPPYDYSNNKKIGAFLKTNIFKAGCQYHWDELIHKATGERLTPKYFARQVTNYQHIL